MASLMNIYIHSYDNPDNPLGHQSSLKVTEVLRKEDQALRRIFGVYQRKIGGFSKAIPTKLLLKCLKHYEVFPKHISQSESLSLAYSITKAPENTNPAMIGLNFSQFKEYICCVAMYFNRHPFIPNDARIRTLLTHFKQFPWPQRTDR